MLRATSKAQMTTTNLQGTQTKMMTQTRTTTMRKRKRKRKKERRRRRHPRSARTRQRRSLPRRNRSRVYHRTRSSGSTWSNKGQRCTGSKRSLSTATVSLTLHQHQCCMRYEIAYGMSMMARQLLRFAGKSYKQPGALSPPFRCVDDSAANTVIPVVVARRHLSPAGGSRKQRSTNYTLKLRP